MKAISLRVAVLALSAAISQATHAQNAATDPNLAHPTQVITAKRDGYTIAGLVTYLQGAKDFNYGVALFPGYPGIMRLREEDGKPKFDLGGNFLVRSRRQWLDEETLVAVVDAPSDQWSSFAQFFRESPRYGADVAALLSEISRQFRVEDWTLMAVRGGGPWRGDACMAFTAHGFVGVEKETVGAMQSWVKTGIAPADAKP